ncbi:MAG: trypsin-like peptidase domain-containing protein [bacterium]
MIKKVSISLLIIIFLATLSLAQTLALSKPPSQQPNGPIPQTSTPTPHTSNNIADIVENVGDAVVNIDVVKNIKMSSPFGNFSSPFGFEFAPEFKDFYSDRIIPQKGSGSGFIFDKKGHILTNHHVVEKADEIKVTLKDGRKIKAEVIGSDESLDLAVLKVEAKDLKVLPLGDSDILRPGEWVIAIGNPYGFANTVTTGIISATNRSLKDLGKKNLIQTDAAINPGNSGGPLLNLNGEVIGINVAIVAGAQSIGFAIPINAAKDITDQLITKGKVIRPWLGVYMKDVDERIANYFDLPVAEGVIITEIIKDSPADKMKLKKYDIIREINGQKIESSTEVSETVQAKKPGDKITLKVYRDGKNVELKGKLLERP